MTPEKLAQVEAAERALRELGFPGLPGTPPRRRRAGRAAVDEIALAAAGPLREQVHEAVRAAGFRFVAVDLAGIQSGAFTLPLVAVPRG